MSAEATRAARAEQIMARLRTPPVSTEPRTAEEDASFDRLEAFALLAGLAPHLCADAIDATPEAAAAAERVNRLLDRIGGAGLDSRLPAMIHARAEMRAATGDEARAARRRLERVTLGGCPCGDARGEALCPWCDNDALPEDMRAAGAAPRRREAARGKLDVEAVLKALAPKPQPLQLHAARPPNRFERRRAASRRWRG